MKQHIQQRKTWYGTQRWKRLRKVVLAGNPVCAICGVRPATQADHVQHLPDNSTFWVLDNLRPACAECNNRAGATTRHARDSARLGGYPEIKERGAATVHGAKEKDRPEKKADQTVNLFQQLKERQNARSKDSKSEQIIGGSDRKED